MTAAELRLPISMPRASKRARVEQVLNELELQGVANTLIGKERDAAMTGAHAQAMLRSPHTRDRGHGTCGVAGISGGERRRVSVGTGLVTDPRYAASANSRCCWPLSTNHATCRLVLLDEPTTGLDSEAALKLMTLLAGLAAKNRTVRCLYCTCSWAQALSAGLQQRVIAQLYAIMCALMPMVDNTLCACRWSAQSTSRQETSWRCSMTCCWWHGAA